MVGSNPNFPAADFRAAILAAIRMASPNAPAMVPTFRWSPVRTYPAAAEDAGGRPYFFNGSIAATTTVAIADYPTTEALAVVDKTEGTPEGTGIGMFRPQRCTITVLDTAYAKLLTQGNGVLPDQVVIGETVYVIEEIPKPDTLFSVDVWTMHATAQSLAKPA